MTQISTITDRDAFGPPPVSAGYKVDISRGERIGRVSSEWFSRPDDERYLSLSALYAAVRARADRATCRFPLRFDPGFSSRSDPGCW